MRRPLLWLALLLMLIGALALPALGDPGSPKVTLQAEAGFEGRAKSGQWIPVILSVTNEGASLTAKGKGVAP